MKLFNNHSGSRGLPCFAEGIYWATGLSLTTPFTEGCAGVNNKASPPSRHQEQAPKQRLSLGIILFLRSLYYEGEVIGFRLFRATGLAFAIRPIFKVQFMA